MQKKADEMLEKWFPEFRGVDDYARDEDEGALGGDEGDGPRAQAHGRARAAGDGGVEVDEGLQAHG